MQLPCFQIFGGKYWGVGGGMPERVQTGTSRRQFLPPSKGLDRRNSER